MSEWLCKSCGRPVEGKKKPEKCGKCDGVEFVPRLLGGSSSGAKGEAETRRGPSKYELIKSFRLKYTEYTRLIEYAIHSTGDMDDDEVMRRAKQELAEIAVECERAGASARDLGVDRDELASLLRLGNKESSIGSSGCLIVLVGIVGVGIGGVALVERLL